MPNDHMPDDSATPLDILRPILNDPLPDALDQLIWQGRPSNKDASEFEHYVSRQLAMAKAGEIRDTCSRHRVEVALLHNTDCYWLRFPRPDVTQEERRKLLAVESALNRCGNVARSAELSDLKLRALDMGDIEALGKIPYLLHFDNIDHLIKGYQRDNPLIEINGVSGKTGGEWDVRTRVATTLEKLSLPCRLEYRFDTNIQDGYVVLEFAVPHEDQFISTSWTEEKGTHSVADTLSAQRAIYATKLAITLAAVGFGASLNVQNVYVVGRDETLGGLPVLTYRTSRFEYNRLVYGRVKDSTGADALSFIFDAKQLVARLGLTSFTIDLDERLEMHPVPALDLPENPQRRELWLDDRPLPEDLRGLLRADVASELDVYHNDSRELSDELRYINDQESDSPLSAIMSIEAFLDRVQHVREGQGGTDEDRLPLYCNNALQRLFISFAPGTPETRYVKIADAAFDARVILAGLYADIGDVETALEAYSEVIRLSPTCDRGYTERMIMFGSLERWDEAIEEGKRVLPLLYSMQDYGFVYYRLAFAYWHTGRPELAAACYNVALLTAERLVPDIEDELGVLLRQMGRSTPLSDQDTQRELNAEGLPVPPTDKLMRVVTRAAIGLVDAGMPLAAEQAVMLVARSSGDIIDSVCLSIRDGVPAGA